MNEKYIVMRDIGIEECPWLREPIYEGEVLRAFTGPTYGCVSPGGVAIVRVNPDGSVRFAEVPWSAVHEVAA